MQPALGGSRTERIRSYKNLWELGKATCLENFYNVDTNPNGCINLKKSENGLMLGILKKRFNQCNQQWAEYMFTYNQFHGTLDLRKAVAEFLTDRSKSPTPLDPEKVAVFNGGGSCMEALTFAICDPGDGVLVPAPFYGGIYKHLTLRPEARVVPVHFSSKLEPGQTEPYHPTVTKFESVYQENVKKGIRIKAMLFMNPNNPLGIVFTKQEVLDILHFCNRHSLHLIMNEVYMNTIFKEGVQHHSVLSLKPEEIPDPEKVHFVWSGSKDMSMSGMRFGVIHSWNEEILQSLKLFGSFISVPVYIQSVMAQFLSDREWLNSLYFPTNSQRLREAHKITKEVLDTIGVPYLDQPAGLFIYADFRKFMPSATKESEINLFNRFLEDGTFIAPAHAFYGEELGWFRIVFSNPLEYLKIGMARIAKTCKALLEESTKSTGAFC